MPANFQKAFDYTLSNINLAHAFLDDIIIITKRSLRDHEKEIDKVLVRLDNKKLAVSLQNCEFAQTKQKWLGYKVSLKGIIPKEKKKKAIAQLEQPQIFKQLVHGKYTSYDKIDTKLV